MSDADAEPNLGGRPRKEINMEQLIAAVRIQCTAEECAALFDCCADTLDARLKEEGYSCFSEFFKRFRQEGAVSLRRAQWKAAIDGNPTMLIWMGKQVLGQRDQVGIGSPSGGPIEHVDLSRLTADELDAYGRLAARAAGLDPEGEPEGSTDTRDE